MNRQKERDPVVDFSNSCHRKRLTTPQPLFMACIQPHAYTGSAQHVSLMLIPVVHNTSSLLIDADTHHQHFPLRRHKSFTLANLALLASTANAFAPNFNDVTTTVPVIVAPTGFFHPLSFVDNANPPSLNRYREAELIHGRIFHVGGSWISCSMLPSRNPP